MDIAELAAHVVDDPDLQGRLLDLCHAALDDAEHLMRHGTPEMKAPLTKSLLAMMTRPRAEDKGVDQMAELRKQLMEENARLTEALTADRTVVIEAKGAPRVDDALPVRRAG